MYQKPSSTSNLEGSKHCSGRSYSFKGSTTQKIPRVHFNDQVVKWRKRVLDKFVWSFVYNECLSPVVKFQLRIPPELTSEWQNLPGPSCSACGHWYPHFLCPQSAQPPASQSRLPDKLPKKTLHVVTPCEPIIHSFSLESQEPSTCKRHMLCRESGEGTSLQAPRAATRLTLQWHSCNGKFVLGQPC